MSNDPGTKTFTGTWTITPRWEHTDKVLVRRPSVYNAEGFYIGDKHMKKTREVYSGDFVIEIDIDAIIRDAVSRAGTNASRKSQILGGLVRAKLVKVNNTETQEEGNPLTEGERLVMCEHPGCNRVATVQVRNRHPEPDQYWCPDHAPE